MIFRSWLIALVILSLLTDQETFKKMLMDNKAMTGLAELDLHLSKRIFPKIDVKQGAKTFDRLVQDLKGRLKNRTHPQDVVNTINTRVHLLFKAKRTEPHKSPDYAFLGKVLSQKKANCLGFCKLYMALGQRLNLPFKAFQSKEHYFVQYAGKTKRINIETLAGGQAWTYDGPLKELTPKDLLIASIENKIRSFKSYAKEVTLLMNLMNTIYDAAKKD